MRISDWSADVCSSDLIARRLNHEQDAIRFDVLYIGQAYGKDGSRNALDRLLKHETLQRISVQGVPSDRRLTLLMLEIEPGNRMITFMNPWAENKKDGRARLFAGLDNRSEEGRGGKEGFSQCRYRGGREH